MQIFCMAKSVVLTDKWEIVLNDENDIFLSMTDNGHIIYTCPIPNPVSGYSGGGLYLSSSEQYLLFSYYSGQSSETFMLFKIEKYSLKLLYNSGDLFGENGDFSFSCGEEFLMQTLRTGWYADEEDVDKIDKNGDTFYELGVINILKIRDKILYTHTVYVYPSDSCPDNRKEKITDNGPFEICKITDDFADFIMPWGKETILLPLDGDVIIRIC